MQIRARPPCNIAVLSKVRSLVASLLISQLQKQACAVVQGHVYSA
jgi:hypothetical protein